MFSQAGSSELLKVTLDGPSNQTTSATVMGVAEASTDNQAFHKLVVQAKDLPAWVDAGCKYYIDGRRYKTKVAQTGTWPAAASGGSFTVDSKAALTEWMTGWILQPNINQQVYLPVTSVDPNTGTLTVADGYASLADVGPPGNFKGARWRLFAPPGTITGRRVSGSHTDGAHAGTLSKWVGADSSRCLYAGYQYESPLAGFWSTQTSTVKHRQQGLNLAGQHYTLFRHYDPTLMRFTSPDPIASPWWNLHGYAGNSPAGAYDPDGLSVAGMAASLPLVTSPLAPLGLALLAWQAYDTYQSASNDAGTASILVGENRGKGWDRAGAEGFILGNNTYERSNLLASAGMKDGGTVAVLWAADLFNVTQFGEGIHGVDSVSGNTLSTGDRAFRATVGTLSMLSHATSALPALPRFSGLRTPRVIPDGVSAPRLPRGKIPHVTRTNAQLVQEIAARAEAWGARKGLSPTGHVSGTLKHSHAEKLLRRYQDLFGSRGLSPEARYLNGLPWESGMPVKGSVRLDVVDGPLDSPTAVYDYKFGGARLKPARINRIRQVAGIGPHVPIHEVKP
ncbi:MAG: RHS repeat-associated core domain-containing protein [Planctomycetes bacterium]|nr:RHS repeat-associated core domain-containing protein [Planctomycetota bacterium]